MPRPEAAPRSVLDLRLPLRTSRPWLFTVGVSIVTIGLALWSGWNPHFWFARPDAAYYLDLAAGRPVMQPFALRQLSPLVARWIARWLHSTAEFGFLVEGVACLGIFVVATTWLAVRARAPWFLLVAIVASYFWGLQFEALAMPDLLYAGLLCALLLLLRDGHLPAAALMMFPLMLTRESTLLTLGCFLAAAWPRLKLRDTAAAVVSTLAGALVVRHLSANALPNHERIGGLLYGVAKLPWNFLRHILGVDAWANVYPGCGVPVRQIPLHLGPLTAIGSCGFAAWLPVRTFSLGLAVFGLLPLLAWRCRRALAVGDTVTRFAALYGGLSFLLAPVLGDALLRLFGYGWPLFLVALPAVLGAGGGRFRRNWAAWLFLAMHLALGWAALWLDYGPLLVLGIVCWGGGWWLLRRTWQDPPQAAG